MTLRVHISLYHPKAIAHCHTSRQHHKHLNIADNQLWLVSDLLIAHGDKGRESGSESEFAHKFIEAFFGFSEKEVVKCEDTLG